METQWSAGPLPVATLHTGRDLIRIWPEGRAGWAWTINGTFDGTDILDPAAAADEFLALNGPLEPPHHVTGAELELRRHALGLTPAELATLLGIPTDIITAGETGEGIGDINLSQYLDELTAEHQQLVARLADETATLIPAPGTNLPCPEAGTSQPPYAPTRQTRTAPSHGPEPCTHHATHAPPGQVLAHGVCLREVWVYWLSSPVVGVRASGFGRLLQTDELRRASSGGDLTGDNLAPFAGRSVPGILT